jgi:hypothetical protein
MAMPMVASVIPNPKHKLLDQMREVMRQGISDLPQPQPLGSWAPTKPGSREFPAAAESKRDGRCGLQGAG